MSVTTHDMVRASQARSTTRDRAGLTDWLGRIYGIWRQRVRERQAFGRLEYRDLRDMGLSQWEVEMELAKPFWRG